MIFISIKLMSQNINLYYLNFLDPTSEFKQPRKYSFQSHFTIKYITLEIDRPT